MNDEQHINKYYELTDAAIQSVFKKSKENPKLILTESDLKCWLFIQLQSELAGRNLPFSVHTEVTHYYEEKEKKSKYFMRDLTILNPENLDLSNEIWEHNNNDEYTLYKGFKHDGPALHFELKLVRQGKTITTTPKIDSSDILNLNNVNPNKRAYCIVWGSKSENVTVDDLKSSLTEVFEKFTKNELIKNNLLSIYLFDINDFKKVDLVFKDGKVVIE